MERAILKVFLSTPPPLDTFPSIAPSSDVAREQHNFHKGGTRENTTPTTSEPNVSSRSQGRPPAMTTKP